MSWPCSQTVSLSVLVPLHGYTSVPFTGFRFSLLFAPYCGFATVLLSSVSVAVKVLITFVGS